MVGPKWWWFPVSQKRSSSENSSGKHRGSVPTAWRLIPALPVAETYPSSPGLQKSSRSAGSKALAISRNQQRTGKKTAPHRQARRRSQAKQSKIAGYGELPPMLNCWDSVFSYDDRRDKVGSKFGMNMSRSSLVLWADRRFAPPADRSHHHTCQTSLPRRDASKNP